MKSKLWIIMLCLMLVVGLLPACAQDVDGTKETTDPTQEATQAPTQEATVQPTEMDPFAEYRFDQEESCTISIAPSTSVGTVSNDGKVILYFEELYNVDFDVWVIDYNNYAELLGIKLAGGEIPDVMYAGPRYTEYADQGVLAEIDEDVLKEFAANSYNYAIEECPDVFSLGRVDGKLYALPLFGSGSASIRYSASIMRGDWLEAVGVSEAPETLDEYEDVFYKFAQEDPDGNGVNDTYGLSTEGMRMIFGAYAVGLVGEDVWRAIDGELVYMGITEGAKEALALLSKWYEDGVLDPEFITGENTGDYWALSHSFINGRIGYTAMGGAAHWYPAGVYEGYEGGVNYTAIAAVNQEAADSLVWTAPPIGPDGYSGSYRGASGKAIAASPGYSYGIQLESDPQKFARVLWTLDQIIAGSKENRLIATYGFEGEDWNYDEAGNIVAAEGVDGVYLTEQGSKTALHIITVSSQWLNLYDAFADFRNNNHMAEGEGRLVRTNLTNAVEASGLYGAECTKIEEEMRVAIITGDKPIDYFDTFVEEWLAAGGTQITEEYQVWYKDFYAIK